MYNYNVNPVPPINNYFAYTPLSKDQLIEKMIDYKSLDVPELKPYKAQIIQNIKEALRPFPIGYLRRLAAQVPSPKIIIWPEGTLKNSKGEILGGNYYKESNTLNVTYNKNDNIEFAGKLRHEFAHCFDAKIRGTNGPDLVNTSVDNGYDTGLCEHFYRIQHQYLNKMRADKPFVNDYSIKNSNEYFADALKAFLNVEGAPDYDTRQPSRKKLKEVDPKMHNYLCRIFGLDHGTYAPCEPFVPEKFSGSRKSEGSISGL